MKINFKKIDLLIFTSNALIYVFLFIVQNKICSQETIEANGPGNTYEELISFLAPNYNPLEVPDCNHASFGQHIDEIYDSDLGDYSFRFFIHVSPDNDRCIDEINDRQRNEIKTYHPSPENLKGTKGEKVIYKWAFKLPYGFQSSPKFTHIHQLKSVGGEFSSMPMYTLTTRLGSPDKLELRYAETEEQITLKETDLSPFLDNWVEVTEQINYSENGYYSISIVDMSSNLQLFYYDNSAIDNPKINWRPGAEFVRPKWGIYRSLVYSDYLRDEEVLFSYFSIEEVSSLNKNQPNKLAVSLYPNPTTGIVVVDIPNFLFAEVLDLSGKIIKSTTKNQIDLVNISDGIYIVKFHNSVNNDIVLRKIIKN